MKNSGISGQKLNTCSLYSSWDDFQLFIKDNGPPSTLYYYPRAHLCFCTSLRSGDVLAVKLSSETGCHEYLRIKTSEGQDPLIGSINHFCVNRNGPEKSE